MRLRVVTVIIRPLSVTVQKQPFYNLLEKIAFPILCLTGQGTSLEKRVHSLTHANTAEKA